MRSILVTGGAGFIGSNLALTLQGRYSDAEIVVVDDFRSGFFKNLEGFRGDVVAKNIAELDWQAQFRGRVFDAIFHEASITDTTEHDQRLQVHDNVEGFRRLLAYAESSLTPIVYASSAATYGIQARLMKEDQPPAPENVYAFSKVQLDNLAGRARAGRPDWKIAGLKYFNVYGPREAHKKQAASMIYQLYRQMKSGQRPRVFRVGEQKRDFVYVKDVVDLTIRAMETSVSGIFNAGSGRAFSFNEVIEALNKNLGAHLAPEYFENPYPFYQPHTEADMTWTERELGFQPQWTPQAGIADYVRRLEGAKGEER